MRTFYRTAIWLPIVLPAMIWAGVRLFGFPTWEPLSVASGILIVSLMYGGIPYAALGAWATWRVGSLDEVAIRRLALRAPLLMLIPFLPFALVVGALGGEVFMGGVAIFGMGALYIVPIGYLYVALVLLARKVLGWRRASPRVVAPAA